MLRTLDADLSKTEIVSVPLPSSLRFLESPYLTRFEYLVWCWQSRKVMRGLESNGDIVLARHVTFASELLPTPIAALSASCYKVWGPVGSSGDARIVLMRPRHRKWRTHLFVQKLRDVLSRTLSRQIAKTVDLVLTTSRTLSEDIESRGTRAEPFPNTRLDADLLRLIEADCAQSSTPGTLECRSSPIRILCVGNMIYLKRFELAIAALCDSRLHDATLTIAGKPAPGRPNYLAQVAQELGVSDRVYFAGQVPRTKIISMMQESSVVVHPSTREGGSGVVGEATAIGVPVVCFAGTGAAVVLDFAGGHGIKVDAKVANNSSIADSIVATSSMPRRPAAVWSEDRYLAKETALLDHSLAARRFGQPGNDQQLDAREPTK